MSDANLPEPLVPTDTDIRGLDAYMMNVDRMLASELWALSSGEEFKAANGLWMRAWKQTPPGSLPNDEMLLSAFAGVPGAGARWKKIRPMAMRGFVLCKDNRFYHKTLCEDVLRAARQKAERHERTIAATEARKARRDEQRDVRRNVPFLLPLDDERDVRHNINVTKSQDRTGQDKESRVRVVNGHGPPSASDGRAERVAAEFDEAIRNLWPQDSQRRNTGKTLQTAQLWLDNGLDVPEIVEMIQDCLGRHADKGELAPGSLSFLKNSAADLAADKRFQKRPAHNGHADLPPIRYDEFGQPIHPDDTPETKRSLQCLDVAGYRALGKNQWQENRCGPPPHKPGCRFPSDLIAYALGTGPAPADYKPLPGSKNG